MSRFATDIELASALAAGDAEALALAERELVPAVRQAARRVDTNEAFVDEVTQRVRHRLLVGDEGGAPMIASYRGTGPLARWVRVIATRIAIDLKRAAAGHDDDDALAQLPAPDDPELALVWQTCAAEYRHALAHAFEALGRRERTLLRQRYLDELSIEDIGKLYRVHESTAFRWLRQIEEQLAAATRDALKAKLAVTSAQLASMERMVASQLELSVRRLLRGGRR